MFCGKRGGGRRRKNVLLAGKQRKEMEKGIAGNLHFLLPFPPVNGTAEKKAKKRESSEF